MTEQTMFERFARLCEEEQEKNCSEGDSIGIYQEKRLHRICKRFSLTSENEGGLEVKVGPYVADILENNHITEIQCSSFLPLREKLAYYLDSGYEVTLVHPMLADLQIMRVEKESGELLRCRRYRQYERPIDVLPLLYDLRNILAEERLTVRLLMIRGEEHRYSERVRFRKSGAYDAELFPKELQDVLEFRTRESYRYFLPNALGEEFSAADFGTLTKLKGRKRYSALQVLMAVGLLRREKKGREYRYLRID